MQPKFDKNKKKKFKILILYLGGMVKKPSHATVPLTQAFGHPIHTLLYATVLYTISFIWGQGTRGKFKKIRA
jgi:hypothetical protein